MLHGARVDRPWAPVAPSLSNTVPYRFSTVPNLETFYRTMQEKGSEIKKGFGSDKWAGLVVTKGRKTGWFDEHRLIRLAYFFNDQ